MRTTVKGAMTPKGAQLNNHAHTRPRHTCPGGYGHYTYSTLIHARFIYNAL